MADRAVPAAGQVARTTQTSIATQQAVCAWDGFPQAHCFSSSLLQDLPKVPAKHQLLSFAKAGGDERRE